MRTGVAKEMVIVVDRITRAIASMLTYENTFNE